MLGVQLDREVGDFGHKKAGKRLRREHGGELALPESKRDSDPQAFFQWLDPAQGSRLLDRRTDWAIGKKRATSGLFDRNPQSFNQQRLSAVCIVKASRSPASNVELERQESFNL